MLFAKAVRTPQISFAYANKSLDNIPISRINYIVIMILPVSISRSSVVVMPMIAGAIADFCNISIYSQVNIPVFLRNLHECKLMRYDSFHKGEGIDV